MHNFSFLNLNFAFFVTIVIILIDNLKNATTLLKSCWNIFQLPPYLS